MFVVDKEGKSTNMIHPVNNRGTFNFDVLRQGTHRKLPGEQSQGPGIPV